MAHIQPLGASKLGAAVQSKLKVLGRKGGFGGQLLVCGPWYGAEGQLGNVNRIARFDGEHWNPLGAHNRPGFPSDSTDSDIQCMAFFNGELYVGGAFTLIGDVVVQRIAKYDPDADTWLPVLGGGGNGVQNGSVVSMVAANGQLLLVGTFTTVDGITVRHAASYDGTNFANAGVPYSTAGNGLINDAILYNGSAYVGGAMSSTQSGHRVSRWNGGTSWTFYTNFIANFGGQVRRFAIHNGLLYASGANNYLFTTGGVFVPPAIGYWTAVFGGSSWAAFRILGLDSSTANSLISSMGSYGGNLICGLSFNTADLLKKVVPGFISATYPEGSTASFPAAGGMNAGGGTVDMITWQGQLVVDANGVKNPGAITPVASWNGSVWTKLGDSTGISGQVRRFAVWPES